MKRLRHQIESKNINLFEIFSLKPGEKMGLLEFIVKLRQIDSELTNKECEAIFIHFDVNNDRKIDELEAIECMYKMMQKPPIYSIIAYEQIQKIMEKNNQTS